MTFTASHQGREWDCLILSVLRLRATDHNGSASHSGRLFVSASQVTREQPEVRSGVISGRSAIAWVRFKSARPSMSAASPIATGNSRRCSFASSKLSPCWENHSRCIVSLNANAMEGCMIRLVTRGRLSQNYAKGFLAAPEDREPAVRKLIEAAGGLPAHLGS